MRDPKQVLRFSEKEISLFKALFGDNEDLLFIIRKVMLGFDITKAERAQLTGLTNESIALIEKSFLPQVDPEAPLFQLVDMDLGLTAELKPLDVKQAWPVIQAKQLEKKYVAQQLSVIGGTDIVDPILLDQMTATDDEEQSYVNLVARNYLLSYIDSNIFQIKLFANKKDKETPEETNERLKKESSK